MHIRFLSKETEVLCGGTSVSKDQRKYNIQSIIYAPN